MIYNTTRRTVLSVGFAALAILGLVLLPRTARALTPDSMVTATVSQDSTTICEDGSIHLDITGTVDTDDSGTGQDFAVTKIVDANGVVVMTVDSQFNGVPGPLGAAFDVSNFNTITARPLTIALFDQDAANNLILIHQTTFDPVDMGPNAAILCSGLPLLTPFDFQLAGVASEPDTRINPEGDGKTSAAVYCTDEGGIQVYGIDPDTGEGWLAINVGADVLAALPDTPSEHVLVAEVGKISLWKLTTGEFQLMAPTANGKMYLFIWDGCPGGTGGHGETQ